MAHRYRLGLLLLVLVGLLATVLLPCLLASPAYAQGAQYFNITGGSEGQRAEIANALETSDWDWSYGYTVYPRTSMKITASMPPYWDEAGAYTDVEPLPGDYVLRDEFGAAIGLARYPDGSTFIREFYPAGQRMLGPLLAEVALHESAHARVWFVWMFRGDPALDAWTRLATVGVPPEIVETSWDTMVVESHAEHHRWAYATVPQKNDYARTRLRALTKEQVWAFHDPLLQGEKPPAPPPPPQSQSISVTSLGPYRTMGDSEDRVTLTGRSAGAGVVWFIPDADWGTWVWPEKATMREDGTWSLVVRLPWTGPLLMDYRVTLYYDADHQAVYDGRDVFDLTARPYWDVLEVGDFDLYRSVWYARMHSLVEGYPDGSFRAWDGLLRRHVYLICQRATAMGYTGFLIPEAWANDYSRATRGDVRDHIQGAWDSERWNEMLLRGQITRLIRRAGE